MWRLALLTMATACAAHGAAATVATPRATQTPSRNPWIAVQSPAPDLSALCARLDGRSVHVHATCTWEPYDLPLGPPILEAEGGWFQIAPDDDSEIKEGGYLGCARRIQIAEKRRTRVCQVRRPVWGFQF